MATRDTTGVDARVRYCSNCGAEMAGGPFCSACGNLSDEATKQLPPLDRHKAHARQVAASIDAGVVPSSDRLMAADEVLGLTPAAAASPQRRSRVVVVVSLLAALIACAVAAVVIVAGS